ncbi:MAG: hypothetical protein H6R19_1493 [Proteobacteria bacterium]|nr:hypothetical protein [Pseudomonadota bacterium]
MPGPAYTPSFQNVQKLAEVQSQLNLGQFSVDKPDLDKISIRGNTMVSPTGSFASYLQGAVTSELKLANKLADADAPELSAVIMENDLSVPIAPTGSGKMCVQFIVKKNKSPVFQKQVSGEVTFPSSFIGAVAIPNAIRAYPDLVANLLENLYGDSDFLNATKK